MRYQGLNHIMSDITQMVSDEKNPHHEQHLYDIFNAVEKYVRSAVPELIADYLEQFSIEFQTYLDGKAINNTNLSAEVANLIQQSVSKINITIG